MPLKSIQSAADKVDEVLPIAPPRKHCFVLLIFYILAYNHPNSLSLLFCSIISLQNCRLVERKKKTRQCSSLAHSSLSNTYDGTKCNDNVKWVLHERHFVKFTKKKIDG